jgi:4-hydroxy-tetrahydrodipicolinate reductase
MQVAIVGYGRMGREIEVVVRQRGHSISVKVDPIASDADAHHLDADVLEDVEVAIEFSSPDAVVANAEAYAQAGCSAVVGTTGWDERREEVRSIVTASKIGYLVGSNFSIGANLFFRIAAEFASAINAFDQYDVSVHEMHHNKKSDSPSGTALTVALYIMEYLDRKTEIVTEALHRRIESHELHVSSTRVGSVPGTHTVLADSDADAIELVHRARNRGGFALGAVQAAEWLSGKSGFHDVADFIDSVLAAEKRSG